MKKLISNIVFTKNRPLQLNAYLESLYRFFPAQLIQTSVIYKAEMFEQEYERLFKSFPDCIVIKEKDFHGDFLRVIGRVDTPYILFGIDDVVYFDSVDFEVVDRTFRENSRDIFGFSFKMAPELFKDTGDLITNALIAGRTVHKLNWKTGRTASSRYSFELCATLYTAELVRRIIDGTMNNNPLIHKLFAPSSFLIRTMCKVVSTRSTLKSFGYFYNPNTLESWCCRWCQRNADKIPGYIYFQEQCAAAIQVNMVNTSTDNELDKCDLTVEKLNEMYKQGYRFDINKLRENKPAQTHCGQAYFKLERT
ncbi:MAG: hypothetical protein JW749_00935 [Sedimentisphaerales bacterium]|nr:hypothetical protein [Sedimentisphaerales bacterium]